MAVAFVATLMAFSAVMIFSTEFNDNSENSGNFEGTVGDTFSTTYGTYDFYYEITSESPDTVELIGYTGTLLSPLTVPPTVTDNFIEYRITSIGYEAFASCTELTSVTMPNVTSIGNYAFNSCAELTSLELDKVTSIGNYAFNSCTKLSSITVDENNSNYSSEDGVLFNKDKTTLIMYPMGKAELSYIVPNSVTSIGNNAFYGCTKLASVTIPLSVESIGDDAFNGCTGLTSIDLSRATSIGDDAFYGCTKLAFITVDENNSNYSSEDGVLFNKDKTTLVTYPVGKAGPYTVPDSLTSIGNNAFRGCTGLTSVTMPNVTSIGDLAFAGCAGLTSIEFGNVTSIGDLAFSSCVGLTAIAVPYELDLTDTEFCGKAIYFQENVASATAYEEEGKFFVRFVLKDNKTVDEVVFKENLADEDGTPATESSGVYEVELLKNVDVYVVYAIVTAKTKIIVTVTIEGEDNGTVRYIDTDGKEKDIPENNEIEADGTSVVLVVVPNEYYDLILPDGIIIDEDNRITLSSDMEIKIRFKAKEFTLTVALGSDLSIKDETGNSDIISGSDIAYGKDLVFTVTGNYPLKVTVEIGSGTEKELMPVGGKYTILGNTIIDDITIKVVKVEQITLGNSVLNWKPNEDGTNTMTITGYVSGSGALVIPETIPIGGVNFIVTSIGDYAFAYCTELTSVTMPNVSSIGNQAFLLCTRLTSVTMPNVASIEEGAFEECTSLTEIIVDSENEKYYADDKILFEKETNTLVRFLGRGDTTYEIPPNVNVIGYCAFEYCSDLTSLTIPDSVTSIEMFAFWDCNGLTSLELGNVTSIGDAAFAGCVGLISVTMPNVETIGDRAFEGCTELKIVVMPDISYGDGAFPVTTHIVKVTEPLSVSAVMDGSDVVLTMKLTSGDELNGIPVLFDKDGMTVTLTKVTGTNDKWKFTPTSTGSPYKVFLSFSVTFDGDNITSTVSDGDTILYGEKLEVTLTVSGTYVLPVNIIVNVNGEPLAIGTEYQYSDGKITVNAQYVTGPVSIEADGSLGSVEVEFKGTKVTANDPERADVGKDLVITLTADKGYGLPSTIIVKIGNTTLTEVTGYEYGNGTITVFASEITTDKVYIEVNGVLQSYVVEFSGSDVTTNDVPDGTTANFDNTLTVRLTAETGYDLPDDVTIMVGSKLLVKGTGYEYAQGTIVIKENVIDGKVVITVTGEVKEYAVILSGNNIAMDPVSPEAVHGQTLTFKLVVGAGYVLPDEIVVKVNNATLVKGTDYTYSNGNVSVMGSKVTGDVTIEASGVPEYNVTKVGDNFSIDVSKAVHGIELKINVIPVKGYELPASVKVTVNGNVLGTGDYSYELSNGRITIPAETVDGDVIIEADVIIQVYDVTFIGTKVSSDVADRITYGDDLSVVITVVTGYTLLRESITVSVNGTALLLSEFEYDETSKTITISYLKINGDVVITATGIAGDVTVDGKTATVVLGEEMINDTVDSNKNLNIDVSSLRNVTDVVLTKASLEALKASSGSVDTISVITDFAIIVIRLSDLADILDEDDLEELVVSITPSEHDIAETGETVVQITVTYAGNRMTVFEGGLLVILDYELPSGKTSDSVRIWHIVSDGADGEIREALECTYADGAVSFTTNGLSKFIIGHFAAEPEPGPSGDSGGSSMAIIAVVAVVAVIAMLAVYFLMIRKP